MITSADLLAKREELKAAYEKATATVNAATAEMNAFAGALQFCEHLLEITQEKESTPAPEAQPKDKPHGKEN
jgi:hypothetical protein